MYMMNITNHLLEYKGFSYFVYFCALFGFSTETFFYLQLAILLNLGLGVLKSIMVKELKFDIKVLVRGFVSKLILVFIPLIIMLIQHVLEIKSNVLPLLTIKIITAQQLLSALYNLKSAYTRKEFKGADHMTKLIDALLKKFDGMIVAILDKINNL